MIKPWRCHACAGISAKHRRGLDFFAKEGVCPNCEGTTADDTVIPLVIQHLDPPSYRKTNRGQLIPSGRGTGLRACDCRMKVAIPPPPPRLDGTETLHGATGHPDSVTCWHCRQTPEFAKLADEFGIRMFILDPPEKDLPVKPVVPKKETEPKADKPEPK